ncbi:MAG: hypothetical protein ACR2PR_08680 [Pseudohongiellaceae bacterium]
MRPITIQLAAAGSSPAHKVDWEQENFNIGVQAIGPAGGVAVEGTCDDPDGGSPVWTAFDASSGASRDLSAVVAATVLANIRTPVRAVRITQTGAGASIVRFVQASK